MTTSEREKVTTNRATGMLGVATENLEAGAARSGLAAEGEGVFRRGAKPSALLVSRQPVGRMPTRWPASG